VLKSEKTIQVPTPSGHQKTTRVFGNVVGVVDETVIFIIALNKDGGREDTIFVTTSHFFVEPVFSQDHQWYRNQIGRGRHNGCRANLKTWFFVLGTPMRLFLFYPL